MRRRCYPDTELNRECVSDYICTSTYRMDPQMQRFVQQQQQAAQVQVLQNRELLLNYGMKCCLDGSSFIAPYNKLNPVDNETTGGGSEIRVGIKQTRNVFFKI